MAVKKIIFRVAFVMTLIILCHDKIALCQTIRDDHHFQEFLFTSAPFKECHSSTIAETKDGLAVAFFAGTAEKNPDVGIWLCRYDGHNWTNPLEVANGIQTDGSRYACWNPVLYQVAGGPLLLFYKVGPNPVEWWGMLMKSPDGGLTWSNPQRLPDNILGPVKNKPVMLENGSLLCPSSVEGDRWNVRMEITPDTGKTWSSITVDRGIGDFDAIQPAILRYTGKKLQILCRSRQNVIVGSFSNDNGISWTPLEATTLPNPNSGIDAVTLKNGIHLLVYNPTIVPAGRWTGDRTPLCVAVSRNGRKWRQILTLENQPGEFSYPAVIQSSDGLIHIVYTWKRETIKHVAISIKSLKSP